MHQYELHKYILMCHSEIDLTWARLYKFNAHNTHCIIYILSYSQKCIIYRFIMLKIRYFSVL